MVSPELCLYLLEAQTEHQQQPNSGLLTVNSKIAALIKSTRALGVINNSNKLDILK